MTTEERIEALEERIAKLQQNLEASEYECFEERCERMMSILTEYRE